MTLDLTLVTRNRIYQSGDFRLMDTDTQSIFSQTSNKVIRISYPNLQGFITYSGIGRWRGRDTADWVVEWVAGPDDPSVDEIAQVLKNQGSAWLSDLEANTHSRRKHTFVLAGFDRGDPRIQVISNFETGSMELGQVAPDLTVYTPQLGRRSRVFVTGMRPAVTEADRELLEHLGDANSSEPGRIRNAMTRINAEASERASSKGFISPDCTVISLDASGHGAQQVASAAGSVRFHTILNGAVAPDVDQFSKMLGIDSLRLVQRAFATAEPRTIDKPCTPEVEKPSNSGGYTVIEVTDQHGNSAQVQSINDRVEAVGSVGDLTATNTMMPCIWRNGNHVEELTQLGVGRRPMMINNSGSLAVVADSDGSVARAMYWDGSRLADLGNDINESRALALNERGVLVGAVCTDHDRSQRNNRPAIWLPGRDAVILNDIPADWGEANGINSSGTVLLWLIRGINTPVPAVWDEENGIQLIAADQSAPVVCVGVDDAGTVLGFVKNDERRAVAVVAPRGENWSRLGTDPGWYPAAIAGDGTIVGCIQGSGFERPWLRRPDGEIVPLPFFRHHNCRPGAVNNRGDVIGSAHTDHGGHALLWHSDVA